MVRFKSFSLIPANLFLEIYELCISVGGEYKNCYKKGVGFSHYKYAECVIVSGC